MAEFPANLTDTEICGLLAGGPLPTATIAGRLGAPERTVRHRLYRLRQAGAVVSGSDGLHHLAAPVRSTPVAGPLPTRAASVVDLAAPVPAARIAGPGPAPALPVVAAPVAGPLPTRAAPAVATGQPASDGPDPGQGGQWGRTVLAAAALGLAVAGGLAVMVRMRRMSPPPPPAPPTGFGNPGDPWRWTRGPTW
jgi:hypothetical protein